MIKSMTAYGRGDYILDNTRFIAEIKSLNNRHRDIFLRLPGNFQALEQELKSIISSKIKRGRIDVSIQIETGSEESDLLLELNVPLVKSYLKVFSQLSEQFNLDQKVNLETLCRMKDVILLKHEEVDVEKVKPGLEAVLKQALDSLDVMRSMEGEAIEADFVNRLDLLESYTDEVSERIPHLIEEQQTRLKANVQRMLINVEVDENRLAQEVAFFAEKSDITEEIVRIKSHLKQFREYLSIDDVLGRRLDFLIQEINREVNTIGSKGSDSFISKSVVEMKAELEKLREQVQNVE